MTDERRPSDNLNWPDPDIEMLDRPDFEAIWQVIKSWDINVPYAYRGYMHATGNHVRAILDALDKREETEDIRAVYVKLDRTARALAKAKDIILNSNIDGRAFLVNEISIIEKGEGE